VRGNLSVPVNTTGAIQGTTYNADFSITGKISEIDVSIGQHMNAGQVLAKLDTSTLPSGANTANAVLTASHAGTITAINGTVGGSSSVGNATTHFIQMIDSSTLQILANVNEADISQVAVNENVQFTVTAYGAQQFSGTVRAIAPQGQSTSNVVTYPVTITVDMTRLNNAKLLSGMTANVQIITVTRTNVLLLPVGTVTLAQQAQTLGLVNSLQVSNALSQARQQLASLQSANNAGNLQQDAPDPSFVLEQQNTQLIPVPVVLGLSDGQVYEVLSGLSEGESILTASTNSNANQGTQGTAVPGTNNGKGGL
jgi:HlyD family secretion protein